MGLTLALCVVFGFGLGWLGDLATGTFPLLAMVGLALGVALAVVYVVKQFKRYS
jgi:F0F1-type ATP synthase assembly protein I